MAESKKPEVKKAAVQKDALTAQDLRAQKPQELSTLLIEKQSELLEKKRSLAASELANPRSITKLRRQIALIKTIQRELPSEKEEA